MRGFFSLLLAACLICGAPLLAQQKPEKKGITKEALEQRLKQLQTGRIQAVANLNAFDGAIQECQHWLDELNAAEAEKAKTSEAGKDKKGTNEKTAPAAASETKREK